MKIKLIALDMDGTTLRADHQTISPRTEKALRDAIALGIHVVPSTGRIFAQLPESVIGIPGVNYAVTSNGAAVVNLLTGEVISNNYIGSGSINKIMHMIARRKIFCEIYYKGHSYAEHHYFKKMIPTKTFPQGLIDMIQSKSKPVDSILEFTLAHASEIEKINIPLLSDQNHRNLWQKFSQIKGVTLTSAIANNIEVNHHSANKGEGLKQICRILKLEAKNVMAIGDSDNDLRMLQFAGLGVAMGNAPDDIKAITDKVTLSYTEDGVAHAIEKYVLA
ncbi:MAG: Cof-type HAD-IIB family hydrolase [Acetobacterium sp.]